MFNRLLAVATGTLVDLLSPHYPSPTLGKSFRAIVHPPYSQNTALFLEDLLIIF
jgi:hypothetical protein